MRLVMWLNQSHNRLRAFRAHRYRSARCGAGPLGPAPGRSYRPLFAAGIVTPRIDASRISIGCSSVISSGR